MNNETKYCQGDIVFVNMPYGLYKAKVIGSNDKVYTLEVMESNGPAIEEGDVVAVNESMLSKYKGK